MLNIGPIGSRNDFTTFFLNKDGGISVKCGYFSGDLDRFLEKAEEIHGGTKHAEAYRAAAALAMLQICTEKKEGEP